MERKSKIDTTGATALIIFMAVLGLNQVGIKLVNDGMAPMFQAGLRSVAAGIIIFIYCRWRNIHIDLQKSVMIPGIATGLCFAFEFALLFQAIEYTTVARSSVLFYTMPFWVAVGAHFLIPGDRLTGLKVLGLLLAIMGVAIALLGGGQGTQQGTSLTGDLMALLAATMWAGIALIARTTSFSTLKPEAQLFYQLFISAIILVPLSLFGETFREPTPTHFLIFAAQVIFVVSIGFVVWFWVLSIYPASDMASFSFLAPLFGVFFGWLLLGEELTLNILIALLLVGIGIILVNRKPKAT
jgi:drug/metabolite transporter (DMT)-like permease